LWTYCHIHLFYPENEQSLNKIFPCKTDITIFLPFKNCSFHDKFSTEIYSHKAATLMYISNFRVIHSCTEQLISLLMLVFWVVRSFGLQPCRWRQYIPPKLWCLPTIPHGVATQKTIDIFTAERTSNLIYSLLCLISTTNDSISIPMSTTHQIIASCVLCIITE
jgi:hypothetical protein